MAIRYKIPTVKKISLILLLVVLLPALFYSGYEISSLSTSEQLIGQMYRNQLDAILFSLNQYAWDVVSNWSSRLESVLEKPASSQELSLRAFIRSNSDVQAVFVTDSVLSEFIFIRSGTPGSSVRQLNRIDLKNLLAGQKEKIDRLVQYRQYEYRKIEPVVFDVGQPRERLLCLIFTIRSGRKNIQIAGMVLDTRAFVRDILQRKLREVAGEEFIAAVVDSLSPIPIFATTAVQTAELKQRKKLWVFPEYELGIRLKGETIDELVQRRFYRNMFLIVLLDAILIGGVWFVYRTIQREIELVALRSDFVSNVSHELRTPLSLIRMFAETLEMKRVKTEKQKQEYYHTILQEAERLTRLINNILNFSRMEAEKKEYRFHRTDINRIVEKVLDVHRFNLSAKGFTVATELAEELPPVDADEEALQEALHNIVDNAIKYSATDRYLRIATGKENGAVSIEIEDRGIGIAQEHQKKIFEKFYRVSSGLVHTAKGSGLGLTLVKHIVDAHRGTIDVQSEQGKGTTMKILLPAEGE